MNQRVDPFAGLGDPPVFETKPRKEKPAANYEIERMRRYTIFRIIKRGGRLTEPNEPLAFAELAGIGVWPLRRAVKASSEIIRLRTREV
ncbi:MAG TPA: hypothetical protein VGG72_35225 [Bryobacteraceae bacterium]|jgi:hypothetical protein